jgi:hypothetical protein
MGASEVVTTVANVATAAGIFAVGWQLVLNRRQMMAEFERTFGERYERIIRDVPLPMLIGQVEDPTNDATALRAFFDYFELCEEELYYRRQGKVSRSTWKDWWEGIALNFRRPAFRTAWAHLKDAAVTPQGPTNEIPLRQFELLRVALAANPTQPYDPHR